MVGSKFIGPQPTRRPRASRATAAELKLKPQPEPRGAIIETVE